MKNWSLSSRRSALLVFGLLWAVATPAWGQELDSTSVDAAAAEIASQLRCPVCRNQSVLESSAELAREMHRLIREKLAAGESPEAITEYFVAKYGEWILLKPEPSGINLLVYLLPLAVVLIAGAVLQGRIRSWVRTGTASRKETFTMVREASQATDSVLTAENEQSGSPTGVSARLSAENERWLEEALRE